MELTVRTVAASLAVWLRPHFPDWYFYEDPAQQGVSPPCMFLQVRRSPSLRKALGGYFVRELALELTGLLDYDLPDLQERYQAAAEQLDLLLDAFPYQDPAGSTRLLRCRERSWEVDQDALHYRFTLRERVAPPRYIWPMGALRIEIRSKHDGTATEDPALHP